MQMGKRKKAAWREIPLYIFGRRADFNLQVGMGGKKENLHISKNRCGRKVSFYR